MNLTPGAGPYFLVGSETAEQERTFTFDVAQVPWAKESVNVAVHFNGEGPLRYRMGPNNTEQIVALAPVDSPGRPLGRLSYSKPKGSDLIVISFNGVLIADHVVQMGNAVVGLFDMR